MGPWALWLLAEGHRGGGVLAGGAVGWAQARAGCLMPDSGGHDGRRVSRHNEKSPKHRPGTGTGTDTDTGQERQTAEWLMGGEGGVAAAAVTAVPTPWSKQLLVPPVASWLVKKDRAHKHPKARGRGRRRRRRVGRRGGGGPSHFRSQSPQKASARPRHSPVIRRVTAWRNMGTCRSARYSTALICHPLVRVNLSLQRPSQWGPDVSKSEERAPRVVCTWPGRGSLSVRTYVVRYSMYV